MPLLREQDTVIINETSFEKFMDYRKEKNLSVDYGWMMLPTGAMLEVKGLIFRTTGARKKKREDSEGKTAYRRGRSCWVKCSVVSPISRIGEEHTIPSWVLKKSIVSHVEARSNA